MKKRDIFYLFSGIVVLLLFLVSITVAGAGVVMVKDINPTGNSDPEELVDVSGMLFFRANDGTNGSELWKSDGTDAGTVMVKDINPAGSSSPADLVDVSGTLFFSANDGTNGDELWAVEKPSPALPLIGGGGGGGGGCFIATAAYGSRMEKEARAFENVRDEYLLTTELGRAFVSTYYKYSPLLADWIAKHPTMRKMVRIGLYPVLVVSKWFVGEKSSE